MLSLYHQANMVGRGRSPLVPFNLVFSYCNRLSFMSHELVVYKNKEFLDLSEVATHATFVIAEGF